MLGRIFMGVLDLSFQASTVILAVLLVRLLLRRAPRIFSYALWGIVLLRLLIPFSIEAPVSALPDVESFSESYTLQDEPIDPVSAGIAAYQAFGDALNGDLGVQHIHTSGQTPEGAPKIVTAFWWEVWILFGQYVWLAGIFGMLLYSLVTYWKLRRRLVGATAVRGNIYCADHITSAFVLGWIRPKIYLPSGLGEREQSYILTHEQMHIRRGDHLIKVAAYAALVLHWFNPLVWLAYFLCCKDMEMSCDEAVIKCLGAEIRADYCASLLRMATGGRSIGITPLAFDEADPKGRIRNLSKWKKPLPWVIAVSVILCAAVAVCLLTDPLGAGLGRLERITNQVGYTVTDQQTKQITLSLSAQALPDNIYSPEGHEFADNALVAYNDDTTRIYLKGARYSNEGTDDLYFYFDFSYDLDRDAGAFLYPVEIKEEDTVSYSANVVDKILRTETGQLANAVRFRGQDGTKRLWFYVSVEALKQIEGSFSFDIRLNRITYQRNGTKAESPTVSVEAGTVAITQILSGEEESQLKLQVGLPPTDLSRPGQVLAEQIKADWDRYERLPEFDRNVSSHMWGTVYLDADTWSQCENAIGIPVDNPLERIHWLQKTGYQGLQSTNPQMYISHVRATAYATAFSNRQLERIDIQSGYCSDDVRFTLTATVQNADSFLDAGMIDRGYGTYETEYTVTGSGHCVLLVTPQRANNTGYYQDGWCDRVAYWVDGNVFYTLRAVGSEADPAPMYKTIQDLLNEI